MRPAVPILALAATAALLTACAGSARSVPETAPTAQSVSVDNCGTLVTFPKAPERVVTIKSSTTEMLLALGVGDRIVGMAYPDGPLPEGAPDIPMLADQVPSQEAVLELEPDLVYAGWESNLSANGAGERALYESLGVKTFVASSACQGDGYRPDRLTFDHLWAEIRQVAAIFRVEDAATDLIADKTAQLAEVRPIDGEVTALWFSSGSDDIPFVGGGIGAAQLMMETLGLTNIAAEIDESWASFSWEAVIGENPDVIVLVDAAWHTAEHKVQVLESNPATAKLSAVRNKHYLVVDFVATEAGVRTVPAILDLAAQLDRLDLD